MPVFPKKDIYILGATKLSSKLLESLGMFYINDHQYKCTIPTIVSYIIALVQWGLICIVVAMDIFTHTDSLTTE